MKQLATWSLAIVLVTIFATQSHASIVGFQAVSGTASSTYSSGGFPIQNTYDQSGISAGYTSGVTDWSVISTITLANSFPGWHSNEDVTSGTLQYDMGQSINMDRMRLFWMNSGSDNNIADFTAEVSSDSSFTSSTLVLTHTGAPTSPQADYLFDTSATGQYLRINWTSIQGNFAGLNEIIVGGTAGASSAVPEPSSFLVMLGLAATAGVGYGIKRRRKAA